MNKKETAKKSLYDGIIYKDLPASSVYDYDLSWLKETDFSSVLQTLFTELLKKNFKNAAYIAIHEDYRVLHGIRNFFYNSISNAALIDASKDKVTEKKVVEANPLYIMSQKEKFLMNQMDLEYYKDCFIKSKDKSYAESYLFYSLFYICSMLKELSHFLLSVQDVEIFVNELLGKICLPPIHIKREEYETYLVSLYCASKGDSTRFEKLIYAKIAESILENYNNNSVKIEPIDYCLVKKPRF